MNNTPRISRQSWEKILVNLGLILVTLFAMLPIATTVLVSFKKEQDVTRKPPVIFPCDTPTQAFDWAACRWSVEGYDRVLAPKPAPNLLGLELTGNMIRTYIPNTLLYATTTSLAVVVLAGLSGYAFSRYRFRGHRLLMVSILAITGVPLLTNLLALYQNKVKAFISKIKRYCSHCGINYFLCDTGIPFEDLLTDYLSKGALFR